MKNTLLFAMAVLSPWLAGSSRSDECWIEGDCGFSITAWQVHVIASDPDDDGPDGLNFHDWNHDGYVDVFVNYEEGKYSRLYFHPGDDSVTEPWADYVEFEHGPCEDSGFGDLDNDGDVDYVANGGWVYFNPGAESVQESTQWKLMTLFDQEQRVPLVTDIDGDGLNDLVVGAQAWFKQPDTGKHEASNWIKYEIGNTRWPMSCFHCDLDGDGDRDLLVADRRVEIFWLENPGPDKITSKWARHRIHPHHCMFIAIGDVNGDGLDDLAIAGGQEGTEPWRKRLTILLRRNKRGAPKYDEIRIDQPGGSFPKGVQILDLDNDQSTDEIVVIPKQGDLWMATFQEDVRDSNNWTTTTLVTPGAKTRTKMDNAYLADIDSDGDLDIATTEENGGWGVVWFENPAVMRKR